MNKYNAFMVLLLTSLMIASNNNTNQNAVQSSEVGIGINAENIDLGSSPPESFPTDSSSDVGSEDHFRT